jgi:hypothetical protein
MGVKREYDYDADIDKGDVTERQVYFKIERNLACQSGIGMA